MLTVLGHNYSMVGTEKMIIPSKHGANKEKQERREYIYIYSLCNFRSGVGGGNKCLNLYWGNP
jgi:hypothetical protein